jgi:hypothetical protein
MIVEKNDVSIEKLFHWGREFKLFDKYNNEIDTVYIRVVGDAEINQARVKAIRASRDLREKLKQKDSDERIAFIPDTEEIMEANIINAILMLRVREFTQIAAKNIVVPVPIEPASDADLEKHEKYQQLIDEYPEKRQELIKSEVTKLIKKEEEGLNKLGKDSLVKEYERFLTVELCETEMANKFREWCAFFGTYSDEAFTKRYFKDFQVFNNLPTEIKEQILNYYSEIDLNIDFLKKSLEVTQ